MPAWFLPLAGASLATLLLNVAWMVQRARQRADAWSGQFLRDLRRWDGRLPDELDRRAHGGRP
jgi:hypothetical protein